MTNRFATRCWDSTVFGACILLTSFASIRMAAQASPQRPSEQERQRIPIDMQESELRNNAIDHPLPGFPAASLKRGSKGQAVAAIITGLDGRVESARIIETPDPSIAAAVLSAVKRWRFEPSRPFSGDGGARENRRVKSTLTFAYEIEGDRGIVRDAPPTARTK